MKSAKLATHDALGAPLKSVPTAPVNIIVCEGWLLKKRRKKMQGFARRYFTLYHSGLLAYSFEPGQAVRDQISLYHAAISTAPGRKDIHIDSSTATFHIKCLSTEDFDVWIAAFRKFISSGVEARKSASIRLAARQGSVHLTRTGNALEEMALTLNDLEDSFTDLYRQHLLHSSKESSIIKKTDKEKHKESNKFGIFRRSGPPNQPIVQDPGNESVLTDRGLPLCKIKSAIDTLKVQHATLARSIQIHSYVDSTAQGRMSPLPYTAEEEEESQTFHSPSSRFQNPILSPIPKRSNRTSVATSVSDSINEWFDAIEDTIDGPEEFFMNIATVPAEYLDQQPSQITTNDTHSLSDQPDDSSIDTDIEAQESPDSPKSISQPLYRTQLPAVCPEDEGSLFGILKKNVGKDLSTITFPVTFNEPLTLLQRAAEEVEYWDLLDQAAQCEDPTTRICYVAAFAIAGYAHTRHRSGRKGFNPMLGETFEDIRMKFIAEKVCHNPLEMAYHAEGKDWDLTALSAGRTKFWGKSLEIIPIGSTRLRIGTDHYVWKKPSSFIRNLMVGTKYFEHCGKMSIENTTTGMRCALDFKQNGYWGPSNLISGTVHSPDGGTLSSIEGKWDDQISQTLDPDHFHVLWRCSPFPKNSQHYYGFTSFAITLNELPEDHSTTLPCTDSRLRPDVRALENGELERAELEKTRVEDLQRERRRSGDDRQPKWFKHMGEEWEYVGGYWEARARSWKGESLQPLW